MTNAPVTPDLKASHRTRHLMAENIQNMSEIKEDEAGKAFIACARCKARKRRCDGNKPSCRGQVQINRWIPTLPDFLIKSNFPRSLQELKTNIASPGRFTRLLPQHMGMRLMQNSYEDISVSDLLDWPDFLVILNAQYDESCDSPGRETARWALVNAALACATQFKMAPGSEQDIAPIWRALYQNAQMVLQDIVEEKACLVSVQALLCMAMAADYDEQHSDHGLLVRHAVSKLKEVRGLDQRGNLEYERAVRVAYTMYERVHSVV
ncbi:hypothetical protein PWT90_03307 [Aphanocladium album]|nr:hypothetical protein PWT90_03307 [Aphanocladium album]